MAPTESSILIPANALVVLIAPAGTGKSTWAAQQFPTRSIISSDAFRALVANDESDQAASGDAFELYYRTIEHRAKRKLLTVADATHLRERARRQLLDIAEAAGVPCVAVLLDTPIHVAKRQNAARTRVVPEWVIDNHFRDLSLTREHLPKEGFTSVHHVTTDTPVALRDTTIADAESYLVIGDVHGCLDELEHLLYQTLGYAWRHNAIGLLEFGRPDGAALRFVGDYVDRGPASMAVLQFIARITMYPGSPHAGVHGNHDHKFLRYLRGNAVQTGNGLAQTIAEYQALRPDDQARIKALLENMPFQLLNGCAGYADLAVTHAGVPFPQLMLRDKRTRDHAIYGEVRSVVAGRPDRGYEWTRSWDGRPAFCVYGHTPSPAVMRTRNTANVDTGCVFGGALTALHYPSQEVFQVKAASTWVQSTFPGVTLGLSLPTHAGELVTLP